MCWLPSILGAQQSASPWSLRFVVPKEYMVIASGKQTARSVDDEGSALHEYELNQDEATVPDKIGFVCCPFPHITPFEVPRRKDAGFACFVSRQKQSYLNPKLIPEVIDFISSLLQQPYPCRETQLVFLPNLFPAKFPKQSLNFAGGLHVLD